MYGKSVRDDSCISRTYRFESELGSGGSGTIHKAWHKRLRKFIVLKIAESDASEAIEVYRNEVEALKNIKSLYVPQVLDFLVENGRSFTVMEYIGGESFDKLLRQNREFTIPQIFKWYSQLSSALEAIHSFDVCHRDIKPANIMLRPNGDICLIDFDSAMVSGNNTGLINRSIGYASPEQYEYFRMCFYALQKHTSRRNAFSEAVNVYSGYRDTALRVSDNVTELAVGEGVFNRASRRKIYDINWKLSDIYSLGATMYHILTGKRPPVEADGIAQVSRPARCPESLFEIIKQSMRIDPSERFTSATELRNALRLLSQ